jgi:hypothetical protein
MFAVSPGTLGICFEVDLKTRNFQKIHLSRKTSIKLQLRYTLALLMKRKWRMSWRREDD